MQMIFENYPGGIHLSENTKAKTPLYPISFLLMILSGIFIFYASKTTQHMSLFYIDFSHHFTITIFTPFTLKPIYLVRPYCMD